MVVTTAGGPFQWCVCHHPIQAQFANMQFDINLLISFSQDYG